MSAATEVCDPRRRAEIEKGLEALRRARQRAEQIAAATGTDLIFWQDGRVVRVDPRGSASRPLGDAIAKPR